MTDRTTGGPAASERRPEIQALRAVAVLAVVLNHLWPTHLRGGFVGVDIFFVISGYLITAHLLREADRTGRIALASFWARRARRLLPASLLVLVLSALATLALVPVTQWQLIFRQVAASALYVQNWALASDAVDYFASANSASPVTHYWSLSVEEQFYLVWPLIVLAGLWISRRTGLASRRTVSVLLIAVVLASLVTSVLFTQASPNAAYFTTFTRAWEFGVGGLIAVLAIKAPRSLGASIALSWTGWIAIAASVVAYSESIPFPGFAALLPVVGTAMVIVARNPSSQWAPTPLVGFGPIQWLGDISYSLYLVHWPLIIFAPYVLGRAVGNLWLSAILLLSIALAYLGKRFIEDPARTARWLAGARPRRSLLLTAGAMAVVFAICAAPWLSVQQRTSGGQANIEALLSDPESCAGGYDFASDCDPSFTLGSEDYLLAAGQDLSNQVADGEVCTQNRDDSGIVSCSFGAREESAVLNVALTGDSHAGHWIGALEQIALARDWRVTLFIKSSCPTVTGADVLAAWYPEGAASCHAWSQDVSQAIAADDDIDLVITSSIGREYTVSGAPDEDAARETLATAYAKTWDEWIDAGKSVAVIADTPRLDIGDIPTCIAREGRVDPCTVPSERAVPGDPMVTAAARIDSDRFALIDVNDLLCDEVCHTVIGGLPVYGDGNHLTYSFSRSLAASVATQLAPVL